MKLLGMGIPELIIITIVLGLIAVAVILVMLVVLGVSRARSTASAPQVVCAKCGSLSGTGVFYCAMCGTPLAPPQPVAAPACVPGAALAPDSVPAAPMQQNRAQCGAAVSEGDSFCAACGAKTGGDANTL